MLVVNIEYLLTTKDDMFQSHRWWNYNGLQLFMIGKWWENWGENAILLLNRGFR